MSGTGALLAGAAARRPGGVALIDAGRGRTLTFAELDLDARRVAGALRAAGLGPGDRIALSAENGADLVACFFGIVYTGATVVPVPILSVAPEAALRIGHARCRALLADAARGSLARETAALLDEPPALLDASLRGEPIAAPAPVAPEADALLLYTSGTTDAPKGVCITHRSLVAHTDALVRDTLALGEGDVVLGALPLTHSYGLRMAMLASIRAGARTLLVPRFDATSTLELADRERVTFLPAVPTMISAWAGASGPTPAALRLCLSAGAPLPEEVRGAGEARLACEVRQGYGLTEATFSTVNAPPD